MMKNECSVFWPRNRTHQVSTLTLDMEGMGITAQAARRITTTLKLSDAIRDLQAIGHAGVALPSHQLRLEAANALEELARLVHDDDSRRGATLRAMILRGGDRKQLATDIAALDEKELVVFCGDLTTWLGKSRQTYFSSFFAVPDQHHQRIADTADRCLHHAFNELLSRVDPHLQLAPICSFKVTNLIAAAGEANLYPKHFAYFLPEDEGVKYAECKRTVVFMNTYLALFKVIAMEESRSYITVTDGGLRIAEIGDYLIAWFRGHDIGHSITRSETDFRSISRTDRWASMVLQEVLADVFGFLLCMTEAWRASLSLDPAVVCQIYCYEMLRYLRRAPSDFPDAGAAFVQLRFLIEHGFAKFDHYAGKISISSAEMMKGMTLLAKQLVQEVLANDVDATMRFANRYCPHLNPTALDGMGAFLSRSNHTLDYVQPIYEHQETLSV
jgi:hypothetical protein